MHKFPFNPNKPKQFYISFTVSPEKPLPKFDASNDEIELAVKEAERGMLFNSCAQFAKSLENYMPDSQMIVDIYPYGRIMGNEGSEVFKAFLSDIQTHYPEILSEIFKEASEVSNEK